MKVKTKNCGVYLITNLTNGKKYVGQSANLQKRKNVFYSFKNHYGGRRINSARKHYNDASYWDYEILEYCTVDELDEREIYWIAQFDTTNPEKGYNLTIGGEGARGHKMSEEAIQKLRERNTGKKLTKEHCKKISDALKGKYVGEKASNYGKKMPEEQKQKLRECKIRPVYQIDAETNEIIKTWESITEAASYIGVNGTGHIITVCRGERKTAGGYKWRYVEERENECKEFQPKSKFKAVCQIDKKSGIVLRTWESIKEAAETLNIRAGDISSCCRGIQKSAHGYVWKYAKDITSDRIEIEPKKKANRTYRCKPVYQIDKLTNEVIKRYESLKAAVEELNIASNYISNCLRGYKKTAGGYKWRYA